MKENKNNEEVLTEENDSKEIIEQIKKNKLPDKTIAQIRYMMDKSHMTDKELFRRLRSMIIAKNKVMVGSGAFKHLETRPDNPTRLKALELAFKLKGYFTIVDDGSGIPSLTIVTNNKKVALLTGNNNKKDGA